ncbi:hypothetical protein B0181_04840 [Moraxella caviae]|uniref:Uncharacterized protein n=1 Tax=Moraxella caviae TaxID=34060 RepID=A0A1T0A3D6_9GAMM|nr:hypothetical protein B0181_04840 [Moraxella caviae]
MDFILNLLLIRFVYRLRINLKEKTKRKHYTQTPARDSSAFKVKKDPQSVKAGGLLCARGIARNMVC